MKIKAIIIGTSAKENWKEANASDNKDILVCLNVSAVMSVKGLVVVVSEDKAKAFGYDQQGTLRSKCFELPKDYKTLDIRILKDLKMGEAEDTITKYFKDAEGIGVEFRPVVEEEKIPA